MILFRFVNGEGVRRCLDAGIDKNENKLKIKIIIVIAVFLVKIGTILNGVKYM